MIRLISLLSSFMTIAVFINLSINSICAQEEILARHPAISPDGTIISFSYQGDIWTTAYEGGTAIRLSLHESYEYNPRFTRDGKHIIFTGNRHGNNDLFRVHVDGSQIERLTWHSAADINPGMQSDGSIFFNTRRAYASIEREPEIYKLEPGQGTPYRVLGALGFNPTPTEDGHLIAFEKGSAPQNREPYKGSARRNIFVYNTVRDQYHQITDDEAMHVLPRWSEKTLYYLSTRSGVYNIYRQQIASNGQKRGEAEQLTDFDDNGIRHFDVSADGKRIVFERKTDLYSLNAESGEIFPVKLNVTRDFRFYLEEKKTFTSDASQYALSPDGKFAALTIRGEVFLTVNNKDHNNTIALTDHAARDENPAWLNDSTLLFTSDRDGKFDIYAVRPSDTENGSIFRSLFRETTRLTDMEQDVMNFWLSTSRDQIAIQVGRGQLYVANIDSSAMIGNYRLLIDGWASPGGLAWSPDDQWLAYSKADLNFNTEIYIHPVDNSMDPVNISMHPRRDVSPFWSKDGSKLGFISDRNNQDHDIWFVWLKKEDWERTRKEWSDIDVFGDEGGSIRNDADKKEGENADDEENAPVQIDFERIHDRLVQLTRDVGNESNLRISPDGKTFYFSGTMGNNTALQSIKWDGSDRKTIIENFRGGYIVLTSDGKDIYYLDQGRLQKLAATGGKPENIPYSARMTIRHQEEMDQMFEEGWRALGMGFYDPQFHGRDWDQLKERYKPKAMAASTRQDFRDMFNHMLGQLDASHMGMFGENPEQTQADRTGHLGIEIIPAENGLQVSRVVPSGPADRSASRLNVGDIILSVNGRPINPEVNFYSLLDETADERVALKLRRSGGEIEDIIIRPASSINRELYEEWVEERRQITEKASDGKLGYIHIQGMNMPSFERFERELIASGHGKEGIVIDVRFNGGGFTTDMLMAILNTRQHSYTIPRGATSDIEGDKKQFKSNYPYSERLPFPVLMMPSVTLINETSYSNAEIFAHAYKHLGHGKLVGQATFGAVISTGGHRLVDGTLVRMPFRGWWVHATDENMEKIPAKPDHYVAEPPDAKSKGEDPQLLKAVELLLQQITSE